MNFIDRINGSFTEKEVFKRFVREIQEGLVIKVGSSVWFSKLIPRYFEEILRHSMYTGEAAEFGDQLEFDLQHTYDLSLDDKTRTLHKQRAFRRIMERLGPFGLKFIQTMCPKDANSWIAQAILVVQSDLPAPSLDDFELMLKEAFKAQGSSLYLEHFSDIFSVKKILGAGTIGIAALVEFKSPEKIQDQSKELVVKILRPKSLEAFLLDYQCFSSAADSMLADKIVTAIQTKAFKEYIEDLYKRTVQELNPNSTLHGD